MPDCMLQNEVTCPLCGYVFRDSWEMELSEYEEEIECRSCEKSFMVTKVVDVSYTSEPIGGWVAPPHEHDWSGIPFRRSSDGAEVAWCQVEHCGELRAVRP